MSALNLSAVFLHLIPIDTWKCKTVQKWFQSLIKDIKQDKVWEGDSH